MFEDLQLPAFFLMFDDYHVSDWYSWADYFDDHKVRATFYLSHLRIDRCSEKTQKIVGSCLNWNLVRDLQERGHTIGHHGVYHLRASEWKIVDSRAWDIYLEKEINQGFQIFADQGIKIPHHFAYPRGSYTDETNIELLKRFDTLRLGRIHHYFVESLGRERILHAGSLTKKPFADYIPVLHHSVKSQTALMFYMHKISEPHLKGIVSFAEKNGINFYPMEVLNR